MSEFPRPPAATAPREAESHVAANHEVTTHGVEPAPVSLYEESFYDSKQTALLLGGMGLGFVVLMVILFVVGS